MVDLVVLQSVSYVAAAIGVCVGAIYYVMTLRATQRNMKHTLKTRQAQLYMAIYQDLTSSKTVRNLSIYLTWSGRNTRKPEWETVFEEDWY